MAGVTGLGHVGIYVCDLAPCWVPTVSPITIEQPDEAVMVGVDRVWAYLRHVPVGGRMEHETATL
jgi:hypothetical protein